MRTGVVTRIVAVACLGMVATLILAPPARAQAPLPCSQEWYDVDPWYFRDRYDTPGGHISIHYNLNRQEDEDSTGTCFPVLWSTNNSQRFVENVGAMLDDIYEFLRGDSLNGAYGGGGGFDLPNHIHVRLYQAEESFYRPSTNAIHLAIKSIYDPTFGIFPHGVAHEFFHAVQDAMGQRSRDVDNITKWYSEGQAQYFEDFESTSTSGAYSTYFGSAAEPTAFWDLSQTLEAGWYHFGSRFWRFLAHNWAEASMAESDRVASERLIIPVWTVPGALPVTQALRPRRGHVFFRDVLALAGADSCNTDECMRSAVSSALAAGDFSLPNGNAFTFDSAYRAYASRNTTLEPWNATNAMAQRFLGKFKSRGATNTTAASESVVSTQSFETGYAGHYTISVTGSARSGSQTPNGDDDDMKFDLVTGGVAAEFCAWNEPCAFNGNALAGRQVTRFLSTATIAPLGLSAGLHQFRIWGDGFPRRLSVRVQVGSALPSASFEGALDVFPGTDAPSCASSAGVFSRHRRVTYNNATGGPFAITVNSVHTSSLATHTRFRANDAWQAYSTSAGRLTYGTDAPQVLLAGKSAAVPESLRAEIPTMQGQNTVDICTDGAADGVQSLYVHPSGGVDVFTSIWGDLHEYSTVYEVFRPDPSAGNVQVLLDGPTAGRFLVVTGVTSTGARIDLTNSWNPTVRAQTQVTIQTPQQYSKLIVGVGAYSFEPFDTSFSNLELRGTVPYHLVIASHY